jgi:hypothetical protein
MINNSFYSQNNINILKSIIKDELNININKNHEIIINETMKYVENNAGSNPPSNMSNKDYLFLMNKKVYDIVLPVIKNSVTKVNYNQEPNKNITQQDNLIKKERIQSTNSVFDPVLMKNYENIEIIDYPRPNVSKDKKLDERMKSFEQEREKINPKQQNIDFKIDTKDFDNKNVNVNQMYNDLLKDYKKYGDDANNFEDNQKMMNERINKIEEEDTQKYNVNKLTPINVLKNEKKNFNIKINKNLYDDTNSENNRNDINSYIPYEKTFENNNNIDFNNFNNNSNNSNIHQASSVNLPFQNTNNRLNDVILENKVNIVDEVYFLVFDSKDRNLELYPLQTYFQVKFNPDGNNLKYDNIYDNNGTLIIREKNIIYGDSSIVSIGQTFDNVKNLKCVSANVPIFPRFHGGKGPTLYTTPSSTTSNVVQDISINNYNPRYTSATGVYNTIFSEPYLILSIPQLRSPYKGNNLFNKIFAKLSIQYSDYSSNYSYGKAFTTLHTDNDNESFKYSIVSLGKLDKLDLVLNNKDGIQYNFGIDKLYIESISPGKPIFNGYCGGEYTSTIITIQQTNSSYASYCKLYNFVGDCNTINSHPVSPGDLIYLYDTTPCNDQIAYFESEIYVKNIEYNIENLIIYLAYDKNDNNGDTKTYDINMSNVIPGGTLNTNKISSQYYFIIFDSNSQTYYYLKVIGFFNNGIIVDHPEEFPSYSGIYDGLKIGIAKSNLAGANNESLSSLFYNGGVNVLTVGTPSTSNYENINQNYWNIEIDYPYDSLPEYLKSSNTFSAGEIFFIQKKMQITYNFQLTIGIKDYDNMVSRLNEHGA